MAATAPAEVLLAILWSDFARDDVCVPAAEGDGTIAEEAYEREREHRERAVSMSLVCRSWHAAAGEDAGRRMLVTRSQPLLHLVNRRRRTRRWPDPHVLIYVPDDPRDLAGATLIAELVSASSELCGLFVHGRLSETDADVDPTFDVPPPSTWPATLVSAVVPFNWAASATAQCIGLRSLQTGFLSEELPESMSLSLFAEPGPATLLHLDFNIALSGFTTGDFGRWLAECTGIERLRLRHMDMRECPEVFSRGADGDAPRLGRDGGVMLGRMRWLTIDAIGSWDLKHLTWLSPSIEDIVVNNGSCQGTTHSDRLDSMDGLYDFQEFLGLGGYPRLRRLHLVDCRDTASTQTAWDALASTCQERNIEFMN